ncbi:hypothetical protein NFI96_014087, partial [Prochilodus magdalenae]
VAAVLCSTDQPHWLCCSALNYVLQQLFLPSSTSADARTRPTQRDCPSSGQHPPPLPPPPHHQQQQKQCPSTFIGVSRQLPDKSMAQFQEVMRQQLESSMHAELEKLVSTAKGADAEICKKDFEGFKELFHRFLQVKGPSVEWPKINRPPEESLLIQYPEAG